MSRYIKQLSCRFHPDAILIEDYRAGDMICPECALVVGDRMIDVGSEWRTFSNDSESKDMSRVGAAENPLFDGEGLETIMSPGTGSAALDEFGNQRYRNGRRQMSSSEKTLRSGIEAIRVMGGRINLSHKINNRAGVLFKHCHEQKCTKGRNQDAIVAACIYIACREEKMPRTIKEICAISHSSKKDIGRCFKQIINSLPKASAPDSIDLKNLMPRFCNHLQFNNETLIKKTAIFIAETAKEICDVQSRNPTSVGAASIFMAAVAAGERRTMKDVQSATGVMESTIRQIYKIMLPNASELFPKSINMNNNSETRTNISTHDNNDDEWFQPSFDHTHTAEHNATWSSDDDDDDAYDNDEHEFFDAKEDDVNIPKLNDLNLETNKTNSEGPPTLLHERLNNSTNVDYKKEEDKSPEDPYYIDEDLLIEKEKMLTDDEKQQRYIESKT
ncbi:unnamed protein product, partial [Didymodactylos carnosus]